MNRHNRSKESTEFCTVQRPGPTPDRVRVLMGQDAPMIIPEKPYDRYSRSYGKLVLTKLAEEGTPENMHEGLVATTALEDYIDNLPKVLYPPPK